MSAALPSLRNRFDGWFLKPFVTLPEVEMRDARVTTAVAFVAFIAVGIRALMFTFSPVIFVAFILIGIAYFLSRLNTGWRQFSAVIIVALLAIPTFISLLTNEGYTSNDILQRTVWLAFPLILSSVFFSPVRLAIVGAVFIGGYLLLPVFEPQIVINNVFAAVGYLGITTALLLVVLIHRSYLEGLRQAELRATNEALRKSEASLEQRVGERTRDLQVAADVSRQITTILEIKELLQSVVERTQSGFKLYQASIFLYDAEKQKLVLESSTGVAGEKMKAEGWSFDFNSERGLVPQAARQRTSVVINDVTADSKHSKNPYLPDTRSEVALPMVLGNKLIGILDLQSEQVNRFGADDVRIMTTLAEGIAIAVSNAYAYGEQVETANKLRAVDTMKSQFLASMSHELRTPLNAILNFTEFVAIGMLGPVNDKQRDALMKSLDSGKHLLSLINDVLDMTKIESGMMTLFIEEDIDLQEELVPIIATAETLVKEKPVKFIQEIDSNLPHIAGDRRRIKQILLNLVSNAAKFTEEGSITLSAKNKGSEVLFAVTDTGSGIAPEDQAIIFQPFRQTEQGVQHAGGTGLGLPISVKLAEVHGGRLWVESKVGSGSTFYVSLPVKAVPAKTLPQTA